MLQTLKWNVEPRQTPETLIVFLERRFFVEILAHHQVLANGFLIGQTFWDGNSILPNWQTSNANLEQIIWAIERSKSSFEIKLLIDRLPKFLISESRMRSRSLWTQRTHNLSDELCGTLWSLRLELNLQCSWSERASSVPNCSPAFWATFTRQRTRVYDERTSLRKFKQQEKLARKQSHLDSESKQKKHEQHSLNTFWLAEERAGEEPIPRTATWSSRICCSLVNIRIYCEFNFRSK